MRIKTGLKDILTAALTAILCAGVLFAAAWFYLIYSGSGADEADASDSSVPYEQQKQPCGVMFSFPDGSGCLFYLDFEYGAVTAVITESYDPAYTEYGGFTFEHTVEADYELIAGIIDRTGGVTLESDGETLRYTGVQITDMLSYGCETEFKRKIVAQVLSSIGRNGFTLDDFVYIIENSQTSLTVPECYTWQEDMADMCAKANVMYLTGG